MKLSEPKDASESRYRDPHSIKWKFVDENIELFRKKKNKILERTLKLGNIPNATKY